LVEKPIFAGPVNDFNRRYQRPLPYGADAKIEEKSMS
jgi:hypothetical protein